MAVTRYVDLYQNVGHRRKRVRFGRLGFALGALAVAISPAAFGQAFRGAADLDAVLTQAIREDRLPGAVVLIGHDGHVVFRKAYGNRALLPTREAMTEDTIFDIASLTKVVATTSGMMKLFEEGRVRISDPVTEYLPEFQGGHSSITIRDLMTHFSGLRPDLDLEPAWNGYDTGIRRALADKPAGPAEAKFVYSDINFILLGEIIHRLSGLPENEYLNQILFAPLEMKDTGYLPGAALNGRIAPTEMQKDGTILRGVVHDPTSRFMGGVAGHAGVFSTADDLARFCQMLLDGGKTPEGVELFSEATIRKFTQSASPVDQPVMRGLGWDIQSPYSGNRGELFPMGSFGHTGFTGTSIWIDPATRTYVILLANSVHPHVRNAITSIRGKVATIAAASIGYEKLPAPETLTGLDVLERDRFAGLKGKRVGLITNQTGIDRQGRRNIDAMRAAQVNIAAIFSPEHGFLGAEDQENVADAVDRATGIRVFSLYGKTLRPTPQMLRGIDALVFDIQDAGVRFYTYETTMIYAMEEAAKAKIPFFVLDRPNPITGLRVEGPLLDRQNISFIGAFPLPVRHGLTLGELAGLVNGESRLNCELHVVQMEGWTRDEWFDATGLSWIDPSPNLRSLNAATLYPALALLESSTNYSVGRGTDAPFEQIGAEWIRGTELAKRLGAAGIPGVTFYPVRFTPASSNLAGKSVEGVRFTVTNRDVFSSTQLGLKLAATLENLYPGKIVWEANRKLIGSDSVLHALAAHLEPLSATTNGMDLFQTTRRKYLLYR